MFNKWLNRVTFIRLDFPFGPITHKRNILGELHCDDGPAYISPTRIIHYRNNKKNGLDADIFGSILYYYMGILVPPHFCTKPGTITIKEVLSHPNAEVRYVGLRILGVNALNEVGTLIDIVKNKDIKKEQWLYEVKNIFDFPVNFLVVTNHTPEFDGTFKKYLLCVPPEIKSCKEAVAWTFYQTKNTYSPTDES